MSADVFIFWFLASIVLASGLGVILFKNPVYSALSLVMTMVTVSGLFATLGAHFIAGVQLIVYAGAVMILFVMVLMLFDLKGEQLTFTRGFFTGVIKIASIGTIAGLITGAIMLTTVATKEASELAGASPAAQAEPTKALGRLLFTEHIFGFEVLGVLLLIVAIGSVALARSKGGTHANN